jgi:hypothetical protein
MEQPVWLIYGIISVLVALGIVISLVSTNNNATKEYGIQDTLNKLATQCTFVCGTTEGNLLSINVKLPAESVLYTNDQKICVNYKTNTHCTICKCKIQDYTLYLNTTLAKSLNILKYDCFFERTKKDIKVDFMG